MRVLVISYFWPPAVRASMHWQLYMVKYLPKFGIIPTVLTVENETFEARDASLLEHVDQNVDVIKTKAWEPFNIYRKLNRKDPNKPLISSETISKTNKSLMHKLSIWIRMNLFIPDARIGWFPYAVSATSDYLKTNKVDWIISVGPPHSSHLIGARLSKKFNIPFCPVFEDPWLDIVYYKGFKRSKLTLAIDAYFERKILEDCKKVVFVTKSMRDDYVVKYPEIESKNTVLYWGYNEENFSKVALNSNKDDIIKIVHTGNIFDYQNPKNFWKFLAQLRLKGKKIKLQFTGTVAPQIKKEILENGLNDITEYLGFVPYQKMLEYIMNANVLLVCPTEKRHVPGKLFEYLRSEVPILAFGDDNKEVGDILDKCGCGMLLPYDSSGEVFFEWINNFSNNYDEIKKFDRLEIARELSTFLV